MPNVAIKFLQRDASERDDCVFIGHAALVVPCGDVNAFVCKLRGELFRLYVKANDVVCYFTLWH